MTSNKILIKYKVIDCIENYNFDIDHAGIRGCLNILKFKFENL